MNSTYIDPFSASIYVEEHQDIAIYNDINPSEIFVKSSTSTSNGTLRTFQDKMKNTMNRFQTECTQNFNEK